MRRAVCTAIALVTLLGSASASWALQKPGRTQVRPAPITALGLTHASIAFAVGRTKSDCDHVELWNTDSFGTWRLGRKRPCGDLPLFSGIGPIGVATNRVVWVSFAGGNLTDWQLWTATTKRKTPRRLRFVEQDTSDPPPIVVGPGTERAIPYAVGDEVTWLGDDGVAIFRTHTPSDVRALTSTASTGCPQSWCVAALLASGDVIALDATGATQATFPFGPGEVRWVGLAPHGVVVQLPGARVEILNGTSTNTVQLRPNAIVVDYAEGRILYRVGQSFWLHQVGSGAETLILQGSRKRPITASLDTHGLAWTQDSKVHWACASCLER